MENNIGQTDLANSIEAAGVNLQYDAKIKSILANKYILAWILKYVTKEFYTCSVDRIKDCIENPRVGYESIIPGTTTFEKLDVDRISGMPTESIIVNEGEIDFDVRFNVYTPETLTEKIIVDVEMQNDYYPGYDLVTRGIFYNARQMSSQLETEFTVRADDRIKYGNIKKVYSIWLCLDCPQYAQNTITSYDIKPTKLFGNFNKNVRYDLMSVVVVCLDNCMADIVDDGDMEGVARGESEVRYEDFLRMLTVLLFHMDFEKKKQILESYGIPMEEKLREDVMEMCNLSKGIEERGIRKGIQQGIANLVETLLEMNQPKEVIIEKLMDKYELLETEAETYLSASRLFPLE